MPVRGAAIGCSVIWAYRACYRATQFASMRGAPSRRNKVWARLTHHDLLDVGALAGCGEDYRVCSCLQEKLKCHANHIVDILSRIPTPLMSASA